MNREHTMELNFPMESFLQIKQELLSARNDLEKEKAIWAGVRNTLDNTQVNVLDEQFKAEFETLGNVPSTGLQPILQSLRELVQKGAAATLLGTHELGTYNLAMLIQQIPGVMDKAGLEMLVEIIRLTIVAGADLNAQKAYAGNGGATSLEWVCLYLAGGVGGAGYIRNLDQYVCCYQIFPWLVENINPFNTFMAGLRDSQEAADWQEKIMLAMMCDGFAPFTADDLYQSASFFSRVAAINIKWLSMLFPFEDDHVKHYLSILRPNVTAEVVKNLINGFTSNNKARKHFKAFFSMKPHWLLKFIIGSAPEIIFGLVKRNEQDLLIPFLKNFKPAMMELRDANGNTLLQHAALSRGVVENTIQLLKY